MANGTNWIRATKRRPCRVCGKPDWCCETRDGEVRLCMRTPSPRPCKSGGWFHFEAVTTMPVPRPESGTGSADRLTQAVCAEMHDRFRTLWHESPGRANLLADVWGVSLATLDAMGIGIDPNSDAFTFPMRDAYGGIVGFRTREKDGRKRCIYRSQVGVLAGSGPLEACLRRVYVVEGESDLATLLDLGAVAVARPGNQSATSTVAGYIANRYAGFRFGVCIVIDRDEPGSAARIATISGASSLVRRLQEIPFVRWTKCVYPPAACKDVREVREVSPSITLADFDVLVDNAADAIREEVSR